MIKFKVQPFIVILYISLQFTYAQSFVDDLYFSDSEVDYSFLHINESDEHNFPMDNDSIYYTNDNWDDDLTYENRIRKFHNHYNFNYYEDYGWHSPSWYNWHSPSYWNWSLNYHHYGWGTGFTYGLGWDYGWHNPYAYNYGWHNPYTYGYGMSYHYYWPGHYYPGAYGLWGNNYIISNENFNFSYGHRDSNNTNIREHNALNQERQINNNSQRPQNNNINQRPQNNNINQRPQNSNINQRPQNSNINQVSKSQRNKKGGSNLVGQIINSIIHDSGATKSKNNQSKNQNNRSSMNRGFRSSSSKSSSSRSSSSRSSSSRGRN
jgi:hypothetical protein